VPGRVAPGEQRAVVIASSSDAPAGPVLQPQRAAREAIAPFSGQSVPLPDAG